MNQRWLWVVFLCGCEYEMSTAPRLYPSVRPSVDGLPGILFIPNINYYQAQLKALAGLPVSWRSALITKNSLRLT